jgi:hypothetical protein
MTHTKTRPSVSYSFVMRLTYPNQIGMFARLTHTIGRQGGDLGAVDIVNPDAKRMTRDVTVRARDHEHMEVIVQAIRKLKVLIVGETIIDEYQFCSVMGKSGKEPVLAALHNWTERYAGGVLAIANHISNFCDHAGLLSCTGEINSCEEFISSILNRNVAPHFIRVPGAPMAKRLNPGSSMRIPSATASSARRWPTSPSSGVSSSVVVNGSSERFVRR